MEIATFNPPAPRYVGTAAPHKLEARPFAEIGLEIAAFPRVRYARADQAWSVSPLDEETAADGVWIDAWELGGRRYSHWLFDVWPKLQALHGLGALKGAGVLVNDCGGALRAETLAPFGLNSGRVRPIGAGEVAVAAERALRVGPCREVLYTPPW